MDALGVPVPECEILQFGSRKVLSVRRFDREITSEGWIARIPQEDFCQALGLPSSKKYESDGGPGMRDVIRVLDTSSRAIEDKRTFVKTQILFWLLAATDGHAKNFSIFHESGGRYRLTPIYDVLSAWPVIGQGAYMFDYRHLKLAMAVRSKNPHWKLTEVRARHWLAVAKAAGLGGDTGIIGDIAVQIPKAVATVNAQIPSNFPAALVNTFFVGLNRQASLLGDLS